MNEEILENIEEVARPEINFCIFNVGDKRIAVPIESVKEIIDYTEILPLPGCPDYIKGLMHLRGIVVPVIDSAKIYETEYITRTKKLVVVEHNDELVALMSDDILDLVEEKDGIVLDVKTFFDSYRVQS